MTLGLRSRPQAKTPTYAFAYDSSRISSSSRSRSLVCYASSKFSINIHKPTNKSNQNRQTAAVAISSVGGRQHRSGRQLDCPLCCCCCCCGCGGRLAWPTHPHPQTNTDHIDVMLWSIAFGYRRKNCQDFEGTSFLIFSFPYCNQKVFIINGSKVVIINDNENWRN